VYLFTRFPSDKDDRQRWIDALCRVHRKTGDKWEPSAYDIVCSKHFDASDYGSVFGKPHVKKSATPEVINVPLHIVSLTECGMVIMNGKTFSLNMWQQINKPTMPLTEITSVASVEQPLPDITNVTHPAISLQQDGCSSSMSSPLKKRSRRSEQQSDDSQCPLLAPRPTANTETHYLDALDKDKLINMVNNLDQKVRNLEQRSSHYQNKLYNANKKIKKTSVTLCQLRNQLAAAKLIEDELKEQLDVYKGDKIITL
jgi:hypothetical protein